MHPQQVQDLAAYNRWMNQRLYAVCSELTDAQRRQDRGAFFKSIHGTLNHLLLADRIWLGRFLDAPYPADRLDRELYADFAELRREREITDRDLVDWAATLTEATLAGVLRYTGVSSPVPRRYELWLAVTHLFNHQTHHRGQLTVLLNQCGKDYGVTDLVQLPAVVQRNAVGA